MRQLISACQIGFPRSTTAFFGLFCLLLGTTSSPQLVAQTPATSPLPTVNDASLPSQSDVVANQSDDALEYLSRGPLHEAYANSFQENPLPPDPVATKPPEPINELPPTYTPDGKNVQWIPGYWAFDEERSDFVWISGVWREVPPGRKWIPGYWEQSDAGYRWVSGFWASETSTQIDYLPAPPDSVEQGPSSPAPSEEHIYVPGNWVYDQGDYQWQPGFWSRGYDDWVWVPSEYVWTSRGCVYRSGYWDYGISRRGLIFAPVYFRRPIYLRPLYAIRPLYTVRTGLNFLAHLFVRPFHRHYFYGDYYGVGYRNRYVPWVNYRGRSYGYDPLLTYYHRRSLSGPTNYLSLVNDRHRFYESHVAFRPPRSFSANALAGQGARRPENRGPGSSGRLVTDAPMIASINDLANGRGGDVNLRRLREEDLTRIRDAGAPMRDLRDRRREFENASRRGSPAVTIDRSNRNPPGQAARPLDLGGGNRQSVMRSSLSLRDQRDGPTGSARTSRETPRGAPMGINPRSRAGSIESVQNQARIRGELPSRSTRGLDALPSGRSLGLSDSVIRSRTTLPSARNLSSGRDSLSPRPGSSSPSSLRSTLPSSPRSSSIYRGIPSGALSNPRSSAFPSGASRSFSRGPSGSSIDIPRASRSGSIDLPGSSIRRSSPSSRSLSSPSRSLAPSSRSLAPSPRSISPPSSARRSGPSPGASMRSRGGPPVGSSRMGSSGLSRGGGLPRGGGGPSMRGGKGRGR